MRKGHFPVASVAWRTKEHRGVLSDSTAIIAMETLLKNPNPEPQCLALQGCHLKCRDQIRLRTGGASLWLCGSDQKENEDNSALLAAPFNKCFCHLCAKLVTREVVKEKWLLSPQRSHKQVKEMHEN